jgi:uncharacterized repeat protein (TIGR03803 family)
MQRTALRRKAIGIFAIAFSLLILSGGITAASSNAVTLYHFKGIPDGYSPNGLAADAAGDLFGTTWNGGNTNNCWHGCGTVFELTPPAQPGGTWAKSTIHAFAADGADGYYPYPTLRVDASGDVFGTTAYGGAANAGLVFELMPPTKPGGIWTESAIFSFQFSQNGGGGFGPGSLAFDASGDIFGTTFGGGAFQGGTLFELTRSGGTWTETVLHDFDRSRTGDPPGDGLVVDSHGNVYGTRFGIQSGCTSNFPVYCGVVYRLKHPASVGGAWKFDVIHRFGGGDGWFPNAGLTLDGAGDIFGTTSAGGAYTQGIAFELVPQKPGDMFAEFVLHSFGGGQGDGFAPAGGVTFDRNGDLFGTTFVGGAYSNGIAYELKPPAMHGGSWRETVLYAFPGGSHGSQPDGQLLFTIDGHLYGTTEAGGIGTCPVYQGTGCGIVFRLFP